MNKDFNTKTYSKDFTYFSIDQTRLGKIVEMVGEGKSILDLGCGDGYLLEEMAERSNEVVGMEISEALLGILKKKGLKYYEGDVTKDFAKAADRKFDVITAGEIIEHVFDTDRFLKNISEILNDEGELILSTPNAASLPRRLMLLLGINPFLETTAREYDAGHIRYFTKKTLLTLLEENDFEVLECTADGVNLSASGFHLGWLARMFPTLGRCLIVKARKK